MSNKESSFVIEGQTRHIDALIQSNKVLQYDLSLAKTALAETMKLFNNQSSDSGLRDHFAGLAMQSLYLSAVEWETTGKERDEESLSLVRELACDAYQLADCMIAERNKHMRVRHEELLCQGEPL